MLLAAVTGELRSAIVVACCALAMVTGARADETDHAQLLAEQTKLLTQHGIASDTASLIAYLQTLLPDEKRLAEVNRLVQQLGDENFNRRETAAQRLATLGEAARAAIVAATGADDAEVAWRAGQLLRQLDSGRQVEQQRALVYSALVLLKERREPSAVETLLAILPRCDEPHLADTACEALWASVNRSHAAALRTTLKEENVASASAGIVALEVAIGDDAIATIEPLLTSPEELLQLAAARALVDRRPVESVRMLVALAQSPNQQIVAQAEGLLAAQTGQPMGETDWLRWRDEQLPKAKLAALGAARLDLSLGRRRLRETFSTGIGRLEYESGVGRALRVEGGVAAIGGGDQPEGDQRLFLTAHRFTGRPEFPDRFEVRTRLSAEDNNNFGWHLGVSIGRIKVLFHPGVDGGAFRAETVDEHEYLFNNEEMGFTPRPDAPHEMTIAVRRADGVTTFRVTIVDLADDKRRFTREFSASAAQLGKLDRIALERSGRTGGAALFDDFELRLD